MGHIERSTALAREMAKAGFETRFFLVADEMGQLEAAARGIRHAPASSHTAARAVVIDAVTVAAADARWIARFARRILISPVCDRADLATHVLVRSAPKILRESLPAEALLIEDPAFAFVTSGELSVRALDFEHLTVGICLSGGDPGGDLDPLLHAVAETSRVRDIRVLSHRRPNALAQGTPRPIWQARDPSPWTFMKDVNLFIGGEGIMLAEAAAQGIPAISLIQTDRESRNRHLVEANCTREINRSPLDVRALQTLLADRASLAAMHRAARQVALHGSAAAMGRRACAILTS